MDMSEMEIGDLPRFAPTTMPRHRASNDPELPPVAEPTAEPTAEPEADPTVTEAADPSASASPRRALESIRTRISAGTGEPPEVGDPRAAAKLVAGLAGLAAMVAAWLVSRRPGLQLRQPTEEELEDFGRPVGAILARRANMTRLAPDLADTVEAGAALGRYLTRAPLIQGVHPTLHDMEQEDDE